jgi:hypothetical protein
MGLLYYRFYEKASDKLMKEGLRIWEKTGKDQMFMSTAS